MCGVVASFAYGNSTIGMLVPELLRVLHMMDFAGKVSTELAVPAGAL